jgi:DNA-directed RNA polymerase specialized sigma subunit
MELIITTEDQLTKIIDGIVERRILTILSQQPQTVTLPTKQGNYTSKEIQQLFNISSTSVWHWERKALLRPVIVSRRKMYLKEDIEKLIQRKQLKKRA